MRCATDLASEASSRTINTRLPVRLEGSEWNSIEKCAENQKRLYQSLEWHVQEHGRLPDRDFMVRGFPARATWQCPTCGRSYALHLEHYGSRDAAVITDEVQGRKVKAGIQYDFDATLKNTGRISSRCWKPPASGFLTSCCLRNAMCSI